MSNDNETVDDFGGRAWLAAFMRMGGTVGLGDGDPTLTIPLVREEPTEQSHRLAGLMTLGLANHERRPAIRSAAVSMFMAPIAPDDGGSDGERR